MSMLLDITLILSMTAESTNKAKSVEIKQTKRSVRTPKPIIKAQKLLTKANKKCYLSLQNAKANYRRTVRRVRVKLVLSGIKSLSISLMIILLQYFPS